MQQIVYTDASHRGSIIVLGIYNDTTGQAEAVVIDALENVNCTDYGEAQAIKLAAAKYPNSLIRTDSLKCRNQIEREDIFLGYMEQVAKVVADNDCSVEWIPRDLNIVADWLSRSPISIELQLESGLSRLSIPKRVNRHKGEKQPVSIPERVTFYEQFLDRAKVRDVRNAEPWIQSWILNDATIRRAERRRFEKKIANLHALKEELLDKYIAAKKGMATLSRKLNQLQNG